ncbi:MAG: hypothetical protein DRH37_01030 [Deltaproteobacteria bacterium]|nr:MAG: hypothetical protein DRH37_01030 [Deltaproteobacteria bacterium]
MRQACLVVTYGQLRVGVEGGVFLISKVVPQKSVRMNYCTVCPPPKRRIHEELSGNKRYLSACVREIGSVLPVYVIYCHIWKLIFSTNWYFFSRSTGRYLVVAITC